MTGDILEDALIQLIDGNGNVIEEWISTSQPHEIVGLKTKEEYTIHEIVAPEGRILAPDSTFTIEENGDVTGLVSEDDVVLLEDARTKVSISKVDIADGEEIEGAHIQIIEKDKGGNETVVEEWDSTTEAHVIEGLKTGVEFIIRETTAPEGYLVTTDTTFTIDAYGNVTSTGTVSEEGVLLVEDARTAVRVLKTDIADGKELAGAKIQIIVKEGLFGKQRVVEEWISTKEAHLIEGLKVGVEYTLHETVAPDGYDIASDTTFTIDKYGKVTTTGHMTKDGILLVEDAKTKKDDSGSGGSKKPSSSSTSTRKKSSSKTGDDSDAMMWLLIWLGAAGSLVYVTKKRRNSN